jgi:hypothetical protein
VDTATADLDGPVKKVHSHGRADLNPESGRTQRAFVEGLGRSADGTFACSGPRVSLILRSADRTGEVAVVEDQALARTVSVFQPNGRALYINHFEPDTDGARRR